jgi:uncharacterized protein YgbK (DUF1537 family)
MITLRLLADDLTGALDTAAQLAPLVGRLPVLWAGRLPAAFPPSCAIDSGTREKRELDAVTGLAALAQALGGSMLAFKKVDSLLRGHVAAELAACLRTSRWSYCVVAPAFPHQGRVTRGGVQFARTHDGSWREVGNLLGQLAAAGVAARLGEPGAMLRPGVTVFDAERDADLQAVARLGADAAGPILWCGSAGLAHALAQNAQPPEPVRPEGKVLGLFGSDHETTARQLAACGGCWLRISGNKLDARQVEARLASDGVALVSLDLPPGLERDEAARQIARSFGSIIQQIEPPGTLLVGGGETLRGVCAAVDAEALEVGGQLEPGVPHSVIRGGSWDGVTVVSKSGSFGGPNIWRDLLAQSGLPIAGHHRERVLA